MRFLEDFLEFLKLSAGKGCAMASLLAARHVAVAFFADVVQLIFVWSGCGRWDSDTAAVLQRVQAAVLRFWSAVIHACDRY